MGSTRILQGNCDVFSRLQKRDILPIAEGRGHFCLPVKLPLFVECPRPSARLRQNTDGGNLIRGIMNAHCKYCGKEITHRRGKRTPIFCSLTCKSEWQKTQKPVTKEWLEQKYIHEQMGTYQIAKLVNRNPKQVYNWLVGYGIPIRDQKKAASIFGSSALARSLRSLSNAGRQLTQATKEKISKARTGKHYPNLQGEKNGMFGRRGEQNPRWLGGITPERQAFYSSMEWKKVSALVRKRDNRTCQRCGSRQHLHIHHIVSFAVIALRAKASNLVLLCDDCHKWVHSKKNINKEFIGKEVE